MTVSYPEEEPQIDNPLIYRGVHRLNQDEQGRVKCVACFLCATACPAHCIDIVAAESPWPDREKYPESFTIDELRCIYLRHVRGGLPGGCHRADEPVQPDGPEPRGDDLRQGEAAERLRRDEGPGADAVGDGGRYGMSLVQWIPWVVVAGQPSAAEADGDRGGGTAAGELAGWPLLAALVLGVVALCLLLPATTGIVVLAGGVLGLLSLAVDPGRDDVAAGAAVRAVGVLGAGRRDVDRGRGGRRDAQAGLHGALVRLVAAGHGRAVAVRRCAVPERVDGGGLCRGDPGDVPVRAHVGPAGGARAVRSDHLGVVHASRWPR